jgi:hypothetical protein
MKKTALRRKRPVKPRRATPRRAKNRCPEFLKWLRNQDCCLGGSILPSHAAHVHTRRNGGDIANAIPLCGYHHTRQHQIGIESFAADYGLDLEALARRYWEDYLVDALARKGREPAW